MKWQWVFRARLVRVNDGDTYWLLIDKGHRDRSEESYRLKDVDTPERNESGWAEAKAKAEAWFDAHAHGELWPVVVRSLGETQTFARWVGTIECSAGHQLADDLAEWANA